jgi:hypothetical protein
MLKDSHLQHGFESGTQGKGDFTHHKTTEEKVDNHTHGKL